MPVGKAWLTLTVVAAFSLPGVTGAQPTLPLKEVVRTYLLQDCGTGDRNPAIWLERLVAFGAEAVPLLSDALKSGPPPEERAALERDAAADFRRLQTHLKQGGLSDLKETEVRRAAERLDEATYVAMRLRSFVRGYQERAINALAALRRPEAISALREAAADPKLAELKETIAEALKRLEDKAPASPNAFEAPWAPALKTSA